MSKQRDGKRDPPDRHAEKRQVDAGHGIRQPEPLRLDDPGEIDREEQSAAEETHRERRRRHAVELVRPRDVRQKRVVEHDRAGHPDIAEHEERGGQLPVAFANQGHGRGRGRAHGEKAAEHLLPDAGIVGDGAKDRRHDGDRHERDGRDRGEPRRRDARRKAGRGDRREELGKHRSDDRGPERRVGPVVHRPGADFTAVETQLAEE